MGDGIGMRISRGLIMVEKEDGIGMRISRRFDQ